MYVPFVEVCRVIVKYLSHKRGSQTTFQHANANGQMVGTHACGANFTSLSFFSQSFIYFFSPKALLVIVPVSSSSSYMYY